MNVERDLLHRIPGAIVQLDEQRNTLRRLLGDAHDEIRELSRALVVLQRLAESQHEELVYWRTLAGVNAHVPYGGAYGSEGS